MGLKMPKVEIPTKYDTLMIPKFVSSVADGAFDQSIDAIQNDAFYNPYDYVYGSIKYLGEQSNIGSFAIGNNAFNFTSFEKINIEHCNEIGANAFKFPEDGISRLKYIGVNKVTSVGQYCFSYNDKIARFVAPSLTHLGEGAFYVCGSLNYVSFSNLGSESVGLNAFYGTALK
jgi:hypothetical protein